MPGVLSIKSGDALPATDLRNGRLFVKLTGNILYFYSNGAWRESGLSFSLADGKMLIGNGSNAPTQVTISGDITISNTGLATIANGVVTNIKLASGIDAAKIADGSVSNTEFQFLDGVTSGIQGQLNSKQAIITGGATTIVSANLTAAKILIADTNGKVATSSIDNSQVLQVISPPDITIEELGGDATFHISFPVSPTIISFWFTAPNANWNNPGIATLIGSNLQIIPSNPPVEFDGTLNTIYKVVSVGPTVDIKFYSLDNGMGATPLNFYIEYRGIIYSVASALYSI